MWLASSKASAGDSLIAGMRFAGRALCGASKNVCSESTVYFCVSRSRESLVAKWQLLQPMDSYNEAPRAAASASIGDELRLVELWDRR